MPLETWVIGGLAASIPSLISFLLLRSIKALDVSIASLHADVKDLSREDTAINIAVADLRARVVALEFLVLGKKP